MEVERGNFIYDEEGKVVWQPDENGHWTVYKSGDRTVTMINASILIKSRQDSI